LLFFLIIPYNPTSLIFLIFTKEASVIAVKSHRKYIY
jgi:hypothetical protein